MEFLQKALSFISNSQEDFSGKEEIATNLTDLISRAENNLAISEESLNTFGEDMVFRQTRDYDYNLTKLDDDSDKDEIINEIQDKSLNNRISKVSQKELTPFPGSEMLQTPISTMNTIVQYINRQPEMYSDDNSLIDIIRSNNVPEEEFEPVLNIIKQMLLDSQNRNNVI